MNVFSVEMQFGEPHRGSGLGLSIAKWIADRHHAVIDVVSFKGVGSRITVKLPIYDKDNRDRV